MTDEVRTVPSTSWHDEVAAARAQGFAFFDWLSAVDRTYDVDSPGVDVTARLLDVAAPGRLRGILLISRVPDAGELASVTDVFPGAAWHERETHEMFGLTFTGFDDGTGAGLRSLLLPTGFEGNPLRKSFVLAARASKVWPGGKEPGEGRASATSSSRRRVQAPGVPGPDWGPRSAHDP